MRARIIFVLLLGGCISDNEDFIEEDAGAEVGQCVPGRTIECVCAGGLEGTQECLEDHTYSACACGDEPPPMECEPGEVEDEDCDEGSRSRSCEADATWGAWSACDGPCREGQVETRACGLNGAGEHNRYCERERWSPWEVCEDPHECMNGASDTEGCPEGGGERVRPCINGQWGEWRGCQEAACEDGEERIGLCGINNTGLQQERCREGHWTEQGGCADPDECLEGSEEVAACGVQDGGRKKRNCVDGRWTAWSPCQDPDAHCEDGAVEEVPCGFNRNGRQRHTCEGDSWGEWTDCEDLDECVNDANQTDRCPEGELRQRRCIGGRWGDWPVCEGTCPDGSPPPCEGGCPVPRTLVDEFQVEPGDVVVLDASPSMGAVSWEWIVVARPEGSTSQLVESFFDNAAPANGGVADATATDTALFWVDLAGLYVFELRVMGPDGTTAPSEACPFEARVAVDARVQAGLSIQITWETPRDNNPDDRVGGDVDIHLRHPFAQAWNSAPFDCFFQNPTPDWPPNGPVGNPTLDIDSIVAPGPESITVLQPTDHGAYLAGAYYFSQSRDPPLGPSLVNMRVFIGGEVAWESEEAVELERDGLMWEAVAIFFGDNPRVVPQNRVIEVER